MDHANAHWQLKLVPAKNEGKIRFELNEIGGEKLSLDLMVMESTFAQ
jgi:hypothetical protein